jgi:hypothetical protein
VARFERAARREPDEVLVHLGEVYPFGVTEDAMGMMNRRFTRREFLLSEAVMDGNREVGEATAVVERYAAEHPEADLGAVHVGRVGGREGGGLGKRTAALHPGVGGLGPTSRGRGYAT